VRERSAHDPGWSKATLDAAKGELGSPPSAILTN